MNAILSTTIPYIHFFNPYLGSSSKYQRREEVKRAKLSTRRWYMQCKAVALVENGGNDGAAWLTE
jgi:hypothetical protein